MSKQQVVIVGAGVGGLSTAWSLARLGWQVTVVERAADLRADGYMIGLSGPGYKAAERMGMLDNLMRCNRHIQENLYRDRRGREIVRIRYHELLRSLDWMILQRTDLVAELYRKVCDETDAQICFSTEVTEFDNQPDSVRVQLSDGTSIEADLLVAADGVHSAMRGRLFGDKPEHHEVMGYRLAAFQAPDDIGLQNDFLSYAEPARLTEFYALAGERLATLYLWKSDDTSRPTCRDDARLRLKQAFDNGHPEVLRWLDTLDDDAPLLFDHMEMITLPQWSRGRVLLLGDAAHCLTLLSGQGAGMAMTSACLLAEVLQQHDVPTALIEHETRLRPAIERLQQRSRDIAPWFIPATSRAFRWRNLLLRWLPRRLIGWFFMRTVRSDILAAGDPVTEQ